MQYTQSGLKNNPNRGPSRLGLSGLLAHVKHRASEIHRCGRSAHQMQREQVLVTRPFLYGGVPPEAMCIQLYRFTAPVNLLLTQR